MSEEVVLPIPVDDGDVSLEPRNGEGVVMADSADVPSGLLTQSMGILAQTGAVAHQNFVTMQKLVEMDYLENKRMVTLDEALGAREVGSKVTPGGPEQAKTT